MSPIDGDPGRYSAEAWEQTRQEARAADAPPRLAGSNDSAATLVPGIVRMSLRGDPADVERLVAAMRGIGIVVWRGDSAGTKGGNRAGFHYFTVEVPPGDGDG